MTDKIYALINYIKLPDRVDMLGATSGKQSTEIMTIWETRPTAEQVSDAMGYEPMIGRDDFVVTIMATGCAASVGRDRSLQLIVLAELKSGEQIDFDSIKQSALTPAI